MASGSGIEPEVGKNYRFGYVGGRVYDPDYHEDTGVFVGKIKSADNDVYIFASKLPGFRGNPDMYLLNYVFKKDVKSLAGEKPADPLLEDLERAVQSRSFVHPALDFSRLYPTKYLSMAELTDVLQKEAARSKIANFMTQAIHSPPIRVANNNGKETTIFTGGPMYKRGLASFTSQQGKKRKQRGGQPLGQPLNYTDPSYQPPSADAGFNRQGIEPPYLIRPALNAIPMRGGAEQILNPMPFKDAYHSDPMAPTGQPLTDLKLPATLRQGLNFGRLSGGRRRNTRRNTRRGGFYPSIMGGVVANAPLLAPLAARQGIRLFEQYRNATRRRRSTRKSNRRRHSGRRA